MGTQRFKEDWAGLPPELVTIIGEKVTTNTSYIRLRLACKAWRRALPSRPCHLPPQSPWLLLPRIFTEGDGDGSCDHSDELNFHDPFQSKTHRFRFPYIIRKRICASSHGWLVLEDDLRLSLFNPITQSVIDLPSFSTLLQFVPSSTEHPINRRFVTKAILSCNPSEDGCIVVSQFRMTKKWKLGFCRIGDTQWTGFLLSDLPNVPIDLFLHKNMVYTVNTETEVSVYDLQDLSVMKSSFKILHKGVYDRISFVDGDSESGQPFVIITSQDFKMKRFSMYKWFEDRQQWCRVRDIGNSTVFFSWGCSINLQLEKGHENQIYYDIRLNSSVQQFRVVICQLYLESSVDFQHNPHPIEYFPLRSGFAMWVTPSLI